MRRSVIELLTLVIAMRINYEDRFFKWLVLSREAPKNRVLLSLVISVAKIAHKRLIKNQKVLDSVMIKYHRVNKPEVEKGIDGLPKFRGDGRDSLSEMI